jgi:ribosomal protein L11 methyltransferase
VRPEADLAVRVVVGRPFAEAVGAVLMERWGPFAEEAGDDAGSVALVFYPAPEQSLPDEEVLALLPPVLRHEGRIRAERRSVPRDWVDGWKDHFRPSVIGRIRVRPPWEAPLRRTPSATEERAGGLMEVVINPGLGFGTGLHPTTRGTMALLQASGPAKRGPGLGRSTLVDVGTGSGILAVAAAKLGWDPVIALDHDPLALVSARDNVAVNGVAEQVQLVEAEVEEASLAWFVGATVLANMTLEPVIALLRRLSPGSNDEGGPASRIEPAGRRPRRLVVSGILAGAQEGTLVSEAARCGFVPGGRLYEAEWVTLELLPVEGA